jgi:hypothetical protein
MKINFIYGLLLSIFLIISTGCTTSNRISMTYYSDPPGAVLYEGQRLFGYTPITLYYQVSPESREQGYVHIQGTTARWVSGASISNGGRFAFLNQGDVFQYTFIRPDNVQGREKDINFSLQLQHNQILQQQIQEQTQQKVFGNVFDGLQETYIQQPLPQL